MKKVVPRIQRPLLRKMQGAFSFYVIGNCAAFPMTQKSAPHGSHCGGMEFVASRPAAGGESCNAGFYFQFDYSAAVSLSLSEELSSAEDSVDSESLLDSSDSFFASSSA